MIPEAQNDSFYRIFKDRPALQDGLFMSYIMLFLQIPADLSVPEILALFYISVNDIMSSRSV